MESMGRDGGDGGANAADGDPEPALGAAPNGEKPEQEEGGIESHENQFELLAETAGGEPGERDEDMQLDGCRGSVFSET